MFRKLTLWLFFNVFAGLLPLAFKWIVWEMLSMNFTYESVCSEVFFFDIVLCATGVRELNDIKGKKNEKLLLSCTLLFILIVASALYGIFLLNDYKNINLKLDMFYLGSIILTVFCLITSFTIQVWGGIDDGRH